MDNKTIARNFYEAISAGRLDIIDEVERSYRRAGLHPVSRTTRDGWTALALHASW